MVEEFAIESVLAIECGSTTTSALLIDRVGQEYRLIARGEAPTTTVPPWNDMTAAVYQAIEQLTQVTGRHFLDKQGRIIQPEYQEGGVDAVVAITNASEPLRLLLSGIINDVSLTSARRALCGSYAVVEGVISLDRREGQVLNSDIEGQIRLIREIKPDAVVIVGGIDGGARGPVLQSAEAVALACSVLSERARPAIIYAGNADLRTEVAQIVGTDAELRAIDNVRPSMEVENPGPLQAEIEELYLRHKMERLPGFATLAGWSPVKVLPTAKAFAYTIQYLAEADGINVLGVDVGGASVTVASVVDNQFDQVIRSDLGLSYNAAHLLEHVPPEAVLRWLPFEIEPAGIQDLVYNKMLHPRSVPQTRQDLLLEQAVAREVLRLTLADIAPHWPAGLYPGLLPGFDLIVGRGGVLSNVPNYGQAALLLLDALQPVGVTGLALDRAGLLAPTGAVATINPAAAAQLMARDAMMNLGTVVAPVGTAREGEVALTFKIRYADGRSLEVEVPFGSLEVIPLPARQAATLELRPTRRFDIGLGRKGLAGTTEVEGGVIGIIIDARGRPLPIAQDLAEQREKMQRWLWDMGA